MANENIQEPDDLQQPDVDDVDGEETDEAEAEAFRDVVAQEQMQRRIPTGDVCFICREHIPTTKEKLFGLQQFCYHKVHYSCVCAWRKETGLKECPACKVRSPSTYMWPDHLDEGDREFKAELFDNFLQGVWARQLFGVLDVVFTLFLEDYRFFWMIIITIVLLVIGWFE